MSGRRFSASLLELRHILFSAKGLTFLALTLTLLTFSDPPGFLAVLPLWAAFAAWSLATLFHLAGLFILLDLAGRLQKAGRLPVIWVPAVSAFSLLGTVSAVDLIVQGAAGPDYQITWLRTVLFAFVIVQIFEFAFIRYVLPAARPGPGAIGAIQETEAAAMPSGPPPAPEPKPAPAPKPAPEPDRVLRVGSRKLPLRRLRTLCAQEHYVEVMIDDERIFQRTKLSELLAQLTETDGVQPHRSWWVSRHAAPRLDKRSGRHVIVLDNGTEVPVARGRVSTVSDWLDAQGPFGEEEAGGS